MQGHEGMKESGWLWTLSSLKWLEHRLEIGLKVRWDGGDVGLRQGHSLFIETWGKGRVQGTDEEKFTNEIIKL